MAVITRSSHPAALWPGIKAFFGLEYAKFAPEWSVIFDKRTSEKYQEKVVEATGYDVEEVDRENATDAARAAALGLSYRTSPGETQGARATPAMRPDPSNGTARTTPQE